MGQINGKKSRREPEITVIRPTTTKVSSEPSVASLPYRTVDLKEVEVWRGQLDREGYTVVAGVAEQQEVEHARSLLWSWLDDRQTAIRESDQALDTTAVWPDWPRPPHPPFGFLRSEGAAQQPAAWYLRGLPRLKSVFSQLWGTEDLLVSMDCFVVWRPWGDQPSRRPRSLALHSDQNPVGMPGFHCWQGMLPLYPVDGEVGGTAVVPGSHAQEAALLARNPDWGRNPGRNFCLLGATDPLQGQARLVPLHPGDLLLWDSRLVHASTVGPGTSTTPGHLARASLCVCFGPRDKADPAVLAVRQTAITEGWGFSHWPWKVNSNPTGQFTDCNRFQLDLTEEQKQLI